jgi:hypothetical protein
MNRLVSDLLGRLQLATGPSLDDAQLLQAATEASVLSPWEFWALLSVIRHQARQKWVAGIVRERLRGSGEALAVGGAFAHPEDMPQQGVVPGMLDCEYYFHGIGCCITHRVTGEAIDVDFYDDEGSWTDTWFYIQYLKSLTEPDPIEKRVIDLHSGMDTVQLSTDELRKLHLLELLAGRSVWRPVQDTQQLENLLADFVQVWLDPARQLQAAVGVGDWLAAEGFVANRTDSLAKQVRRRAATCMNQRGQELFRIFRDDKFSHVALQALAEMNATQLRDALQMALRGSPTGAMNRALEMLIDQGDASWDDEVWRLFRRLSPKTDIPEPAAWVNCAAFLLKHGFRKQQVIESLLEAVNRETGEAALLLLEHQPADARVMFHRALRASIPMERNLAAAALAVLDEPWCHEELMGLLATATDQEVTADARAALACSNNPACHAALAEWERRYPYTPEPGPFYSATDMALRHCNQWLQHEMAQLHDRVLPLRGRVK